MTKLEYYTKPSDNTLHAFDSSDPTQMALVTPDMVLLTDAEVSAILNPVTIIPVLTLEQAQADQIITLTNSYNAAIQLPVSYMDTIFQADTGSQTILANTLIAGSLPDNFYWLDSRNNKVPMDYTQLQGLAKVMLIQGQLAFDKLHSLKTNVNASLTVAQVTSYVW